MGILDVFGALDLIDRFDGLVFRARRGGAHRFEIPYNPTWTGHQVAKLLRRYHIDVAGRGYNDDGVSFLVSHKQASWAEYVMLRAGVPLAGKLLDKRNAAWAARHDGPPTPWEELER